MKESEYLDAGADTLEQSVEWFRPGRGDGLVGHCMITALPEGARRWSSVIESWPRTRLQQAMHEKVPGLPGVIGLATFNDEYAESKEQCVEIMRYAAQLAREEEDSDPATTGS